MTEDEARACCAQLVPRGTFGRIESYLALLEKESRNQNLVSATTMPQVWERHILDSLQLLALAPPAGSWLDIGAGAGLPGLVIACAGRHQLTLVEPRRRRADFLAAVAEALALDAIIVAGRVETLAAPPFTVISARAVAALDTLFGIASHVAGRTTTWVLPKGRSAAKELEDATESWQGSFRIEPSHTDAAAGIVVATNVHRRPHRGTGR